MAPAKPKPLVSYGIVTEGTGPERKHTLLRLVTDGPRVTEAKPLFSSRWRDLCEDELRRAMRHAK